MDVMAGHPALVVLGGRDPAGAHERDQVLLHDLEVFELLVEMAGEQQHGVFQLAFAVTQRALAELPAMTVAPMAMAAISSMPPRISQRIGPPRKADAILNGMVPVEAIERDRCQK